MSRWQWSDTLREKCSLPKNMLTPRAIIKLVQRPCVPCSLFPIPSVPCQYTHTNEYWGIGSCAKMLFLAPSSFELFLWWNYGSQGTNKKSDAQLFDFLFSQSHTLLNCTICRDPFSSRSIVSWIITSSTLAHLPIENKKKEEICHRFLSSAGLKNNRKKKK